VKKTHLILAKTADLGPQIGKDWFVYVY